MSNIRKGIVTVTVISPKGKYKDENTYRDIVNYCTRKDKCRSGYIMKKNLYTDRIANEMEQHAAKFDKNSGTRIRHIVISTRGEKANPDTVCDFAEVACEHYMDNYQVFAAIHEDTENPHCHVIINMIGLDGQRYRGRKKDYYGFQKEIRKTAHEHNMTLYVD